jgi:cytochrome c5
MQSVRVLFAGLSSGVVGVALGALVGTIAADAAELPAGPNREIVARECQACHDLDMVIAGAGATRDDWDGALEQMVGYGMNVSPEDRAKILDYLATSLGTDAKPGAR